MDPPTDPYYRAALAWAHHQGFGFHADECAPDILGLLEPVRRRGGLVLEVGCGSGLLTRHLVAAGHRVIATDASPAMLELAAAEVGAAADVRRLTLPDDPLPHADAIVSVGHALSYLPDEAAIRRGLEKLADALLPDGILAIDLCDLRWGEARRDQRERSRVGDDWALITRFSMPADDRFVREMTAFVRRGDGSWTRDDERHDNVLIDTATVPPLLAARGVEASVKQSFGDHPLPEGLVAIIGRRPVAARGPSEPSGAIT